LNQNFIFAATSPCQGKVELTWGAATDELIEQEKSVAEIYLKISYSFPCERINIFVTVIHFGMQAFQKK
jgi:hypothetical protein